LFIRFYVLAHVLKFARSIPKIAESDLTHLGALPFKKVGRIRLIRSGTSIAAICLIGATAVLLGRRAA
jgi:hypothetical protein